MGVFIIRFFICNLFISAMIGLLLAAKYLFRNQLSARMQYNLWFFMLVLLALPFLSVQSMMRLPIASWFEGLGNPLDSHAVTSSETTAAPMASAVNWMNDFAVSVSSETPSATGIVLCGLWIAGILAILALIAKSQRRLYHLQKSALPLQNEEILQLYQSCLHEMKITRGIPIYSTAFLKSPMITGLCKPHIYLPVHLISDCDCTDIRYMLLHELQHYKHKDALANLLMHLACTLYWFNPLVWYALREMRNDREVACDTSVLKMLEDDCYVDYGNTLINFAERVSLSSFPFAAGLGGNMRQMKRRIHNIASYKKPSVRKRMRSMAAFIATAVLLMGLAPILSAHASDNTYYHWNISRKNLSLQDLSSHFCGLNGSFVLYDLEGDLWTVYHKKNAVTRISPNSTYKIYDALFGLDSGVITPRDSLITWNHNRYPFEAWNADQTLTSAMRGSVNWYFQAIDRQLKGPLVSQYVQRIGYGNENTSGDLTSYWMESSLRISPVEQVQLLAKLYENRLPFAPENMNAVKNSIHISSFENGALYGKTGTGRIDGHDVNGWFIGYVESADRTYFFATNVQGDKDASGSTASDISRSILSDMGIEIRY